MKRISQKDLKHLIWIIWILTGVIDIVIIILLFLLKFIDEYNPRIFNYVYDGGTIKENWFNTFLIIDIICFVTVVLLFVISIILSVRIKKKSTKTKIFGKITITILLFLFSIGIFGFCYIIGTGDNYIYEPEYYEFSYENHKIVICEESFLVGGYGTVYQIKDDNSAYMIKKFITDDGYRNKGNYTLEWSDSYIDIYYDNGVSKNKAKVTAYFVD